MTDAPCKLWSHGSGSAPQPSPSAAVLDALFALLQGLGLITGNVRAVLGAGFFAN